MKRDLRDTPLYKQIEEHYRRMHEPAFGRISGASDPAPSPDGRSVAFTGSRLHKLEGVPETRVCVIERTRELEEVTAGPNDDRLPRWSPDGERVAFLSNRVEKETTQLYVLERGRFGEARGTPQVDGSVEYHSWSPSGGSILFGVAELGADLAGAQGSGKMEGSKEGLPSWIPAVERAPPEGGWRRAWVHDVASGQSRPASGEGLNVWEAAWCGEGAIAAIVSDSPGEEAWYTAALALIHVESGKERILHRDERQLGLPAASPSGRRLAVVHALCSDRMVLAGDLLLVEVESGDSERVDTLGVDVTHLVWRDEERLLFAGLRGLETVVGEYQAREGRAAELWSTTESSGDFYPEVQPVGADSFAIALESYERYPEIAVVTEGRVDVLTSLAHEGSRYVGEVGGRLERVAWTAADGLAIQGLLVRPDGPGPHPLITLVHGGPVWAFANRWSMGRGLTPLLVSRGYAVLHPNPRGSTGRGQRFAEMVYGDMGGGDAGDILAGVDEMVARQVADPRRLGVIGGSYGGFMSAWLVTRSERFAAAAALSPVTDWYSQHYSSNIGFFDEDFMRDAPATAGGAYFERSPVMFANRVRTPTLLTAGAHDKCTPPGQAVEFHQALAEQGVESELAIYPEEGHGVRNLPAVIDWHARIVAWFERYMPARAP